VGAAVSRSAQGTCLGVDWVPSLVSSRLPSLRNGEVAEKLAMWIGRGAQRGVQRGVWARASPRGAACSDPSTLGSDHGRQTVVRDAHCPASAKTRRPWPTGRDLRWLVIAAASCFWIVAQAFIPGGVQALPAPPSPTPVPGPGPRPGPSLTPAQTIRPVESPAAACQVSDLLSVVSAPSKAVVECWGKWGPWGVFFMGALLLIWAVQSLEAVHKLMRWLWATGRRGWRWLRHGVGRLLGGLTMAMSRHPSPRVSPPARSAPPPAQPVPASEAPGAPALAALSRANPFGDRGCIRDPARFFNRERELAEIFDELRKGSSLSLVGEAQVGKSSLLAMIAVQGPQELQRDPADFITIDMQVIRNEAEFFEALCEKLGLGLTVRGWDLDKALRGRQVVVCLDEIEKMTNRQCFSGEERTELRGHASGPDSPLTLVIASRSPLEMLFEDNPLRTSPLASLCHALRLVPFSQATSEAFLLHRLQGHAVAFSARQRQMLHEQSGGHPGQLQAAAAALYNQLLEP
jgi:hypothetical protein